MTNIKEVEFTVMLTSDDRYRHIHVRFKGNVLSFVVQVRNQIGGEMVSCGKI